MPHCCVPQCTHRSETNPELSFYRFPSDSKTRQNWLSMIRSVGGSDGSDRHGPVLGARRDEFQPTPNTRVCSWHFPQGKDGGPSRFHWTHAHDEVTENVSNKHLGGSTDVHSYSKKRGVKRKPPAVQNSLELLASAASVVESSSPRKKRPVKRRAKCDTDTSENDSGESVKDNTADDVEKDNLHTYAKKNVPCNTINMKIVKLRHI